MEDKLSPQSEEWLLKAIPLLCERAKTVGEIVEASGFLLSNGTLRYQDDLVYSLSPKSYLLSEFLSDFSPSQDWQQDHYQGAIDDFVEKKDLHIRDFGPMLRVALCNSTTSPSVSAIMEILGCDEVVNRLKAFNTILSNHE